MGDGHFSSDELVGCEMIAPLLWRLQTKKADVDKEMETGNGSGLRRSEKTAGKKDRKHNSLAVLRVFLNIRNGSWILTIFFVGLCNGLIWGFLFWHLDNLGTSVFAQLMQRWKQV